MFVRPVTAEPLKIYISVTPWFICFKSDAVVYRSKLKKLCHFLNIYEPNCKYIHCNFLKTWNKHFLQPTLYAHMLQLSCCAGSGQGKTACLLNSPCPLGWRDTREEIFDCIGREQESMTSACEGLWQFGPVRHADKHGRMLCLWKIISQSPSYNIFCCLKLSLNKTDQDFFFQTGF